jgi:hypothetical protein
MRNIICIRLTATKIHIGLELDSIIKEQISLNSNCLVEFFIKVENLFQPFFDLNIA